LRVVLAILGSVAAALSVNSPTDGYDVTQIHIAQGNTPTSMTISWVTKSDCDTEVKFGETSDEMDQSVLGYTTSYNFDYPSFGVYESGTIHHVQLTNLKTDTNYFYQAGDFSSGATSGVLFFKTLPTPGDSRPFMFGVVGDLGQTTDSQTTLNHMMGNKDVAMILHAGDLSYADCNQTLWDSYGNMVEVLSRERPWMVGPGNHEIEFNNDGTAFVAFENRYKMPAIKPAEFGQVTIPPGIDSNGNPYCCSSVFQTEYNYGNSFYSFEAASAHVIYLNPYSTSNETSVQYQWLKQDLLSVDRTVTPWVIVVMHCPWYNSNQAHYAEKQAVLMRDSMEHLFLDNHVNIVFAGHVHAYERSFPIYQNITAANGVVYVTIGDGGNREGHASGYREQPDWSAYRNGTQYGYGSLLLQDKHKMQWKWFRNVDGSIVDSDEVTICNAAFGNAFCL